MIRLVFIEAMQPLSWIQLTCKDVFGMPGSDMVDALKVKVVVCFASVVDDAAPFVCVMMCSSALDLSPELRTTLRPNSISQWLITFYIGCRAVIF